MRNIIVLKEDYEDITNEKYEVSDQEGKRM